jgi:hypothetical protein
MITIIYQQINNLSNELNCSINKYISNIKLIKLHFELY